MLPLMTGFVLQLASFNDYLSSTTGFFQRLASSSDWLPPVTGFLQQQDHDGDLPSSPHRQLMRPSNLVISIFHDMLQGHHAQMLLLWCL